MNPNRAVETSASLQWSGRTDRGKVRLNNEDAFLGLQFDGHEVNHLGKIGAAPMTNTDFAFAVSDGMGGAKAGEFASRFAVEKITKLADVILQAQSSQVLESINLINQLARGGKLRSAMDEAFHAIAAAPTYLPLHTLMGDLLVRENHTQDAIAKYTVVAAAYSVRGESVQAAKMLRRVVQLAPMDMSTRTKLIDQLVARGQVDEAIREYLELADIYYRLAELDMARKTFTTALRFVQQSNADRKWNADILRRMADIDMQRLDWKQAIRIFEQIRTLHPEDESTRKNLIDLSLKMGQPAQASAEIESYLSYLQSMNHSNQGVPFIEDLLVERPDDSILRRALAQAYQHAGRMQDAVTQLDSIAESLLDLGKKEEAMAIVNQILLMNPPNADQYRQLLTQLQS